MLKWKTKNLLSKYKLTALAFIMVIAAQAFVPAFVSRAFATSTLTYTQVRFDRMKQSTGGAGDVFTSGTVCAKTPDTVTETSVKVTFPTGMTVSSTVGNWTVSTGTTTSWPKDPADGTTSATAWPSIGAPTGSGEFVISGQSVNFQSGDLTANTWYCFNWTNTSAALKTNSSTGNDQTGSVTTQTTGGAADATGNFATSTVSNDQIAVTATVNPTFSFALSSNSASLPALTTSGVSASAINATVSTNAFKGWNLWAADPAGTPGLTSAHASKTIGYSPSAGNTAATISGEGMNLGAGTATGTTCTGVSADANFASGGTSFKGGGLDNTPRIVATATGVADTCSMPLTVNAQRSNTTPAATDYSGTITVIAAGRF